MIILQNCAVSFDIFVAYLAIIDELIIFSLHMIRNKKWADLGVMTLGSWPLEPIVLLLSMEKHGYLRLESNDIKDGEVTPCSIPFFFFI